MQIITAEKPQSCRPYYS